MKIFNDEGIVTITDATCDKDHQGWLEMVGANKASTVTANGIGTPTASCEGGKNGSTGEIVMYGRFTVSVQQCTDIDW